MNKKSKMIRYDDYAMRSANSQNVYNIYCQLWWTEAVYTFPLKKTSSPGKVLKLIRHQIKFEVNNTKLKFLTLWPINSGVLTSLLLPHLSSSLTDSLSSLNLLFHSKTDARFMQDAPKAVWSIPCVSVGVFFSLKQIFIVYRSSKVSWRPDCIFKIHQLWQSGFSRVYSNCCCSWSFKPEVIKIDQASYKMYSNNIVNFQ